MSIKDFISELQVTQRESIAHIEHIPGRAALFGELIPEPPPPIADALMFMGIGQLYSHQSEAIMAARRGENTLQATPTASGKTLGFIIPTLEAIYEDRNATALFIFPTKALARDQLRNLNKLLEFAPSLKPYVRAGVYDGDTPQQERRKIRAEANIVITNPDMLHGAILPHHGLWSRFISNLRFIVIDELHVYRGIFGSNVANVVRRLRRITSHYKTDPQYLMASATIANPTEHAREIINDDVTVISKNGAPRGERYFLIINPPFKDKKKQTRRSANAEATSLFTNLITRGIQTIVFTRARVVAELIYRYAFDELGPRLGNRISPYRGGYLPEERRQIERQLAAGELLGVTSTNALELGIDIGSLDASILVGFPGSIASLLQQAGRAGRRSDTSLSILISYDDPIDQYLSRNPDYVFGGSPEAALIDADNPYIVSGHLRCATQEIPLDFPAVQQFGENSPEILNELAHIGEVSAKNEKYWWISRDYPASQTNLRTGGDNTVTITDVTDESSKKTIGMLDYESALEQLHPEAIYLQNGETYFVRDLDIGQKVAYLEKRDVDYYTQAMVETDLRLNEQLNQEDYGTFTVGFGEVTVTWATVGFKKIKFYKIESIGWAAMQMPQVKLDTTAVYITPHIGTIAKVQSEGLNPYEALWGLKNALLAVIPLLAMCDPRDLAGVVDSSNLGQPTVFIYDKFPGGLGYGQHAFFNIGRVMDDVYKLVTGCSCRDGCPACVGPGIFTPDQVRDPDLKQGHHIPVKQATVKLVNYLLG